MDPGSPAPPPQSQAIDWSFTVDQWHKAFFVSLQNKEKSLATYLSFSHLPRALPCQLSQLSLRPGTCPDQIPLLPNMTRLPNSSTTSKQTFWQNPKMSVRSVSGLICKVLVARQYCDHRCIPSAGKTPTPSPTQLPGGGGEVIAAQRLHKGKRLTGIRMVSSQTWRVWEKLIFIEIVISGLGGLGLGGCNLWALWEGERFVQGTGRGPTAFKRNPHH